MTKIDKHGWVLSMELETLDYPGVPQGTLPLWSALAIFLCLHEPYPILPSALNNHSCKHNAAQRFSAFWPRSSVKHNAAHSESASTVTTFTYLTREERMCRPYRWRSLLTSTNWYPFAFIGLWSLVSLCPQETHTLSICWQNQILRLQRCKTNWKHIHPSNATSWSLLENVQLTLQATPLLMRGQVSHFLHLETSTLTVHIMVFTQEHQFTVKLTILSAIIDTVLDALSI